MKKGEKELELAKWLSKKFGGKVYVNKKDVRWDVYNLDLMKKILTNIKPFLRLRRRQCELLLQIIELMEKEKDKYLIGYSKETILKIAKLFEELRGLSSKSNKNRIKWTYDTIKQFVESNPLYTEEYKKEKVEKFMKASEKTRFRKGVPLPPEIEEKRRKNHRMATIKYPDEIVRKAKELYKKGYKPSEIAKMLNISRSTLKTWLYGHRRKNVVV